MKSVMRMRHYCDFCKKSGATRPSMAKHEAGCTLNPGRKCRFCELSGNVQLPMAEILEILYTKRYKAMREAVGNCPACILAALRQQHNDGLPAFGTPEELDAIYEGSHQFDFKAESEAFWKDYNADQQPYGGY